MGETSEAELVAALGRGEKAAFDEVYARYHARIYRFLIRLAGRRELAEDLFQETFLQLARRGVALREDTSLAAWLFTVARNQYRNHRRWARRDRTRTLGLEPNAHASGPAEQVEARRELDALEAALPTLPPASREVLLLITVEGLEPARAAEVLGIVPAALRQRLSRARVQLAETMERERRRAAHPRREQALRLWSRRVLPALIVCACAIYLHWAITFSAGIYR